MMVSNIASTIGPAVLVALIISWLAARLIVATKGWHGRLSMDTDDGVQKFHDAPTPRVGGVALMAGLLASLPFIKGEAFALLSLALMCSSFAFAAGLIEDVTKNVSPRNRLLAAMLSGLAFVATAGVLTPLAEPLVPAGAGDMTSWIIYGLGALGIIVGLAGTTNAVNIIDGFHGLASGSLIIMSTTFAGLALWQGDTALALMCVVFAAAVAGFMVVNFPRGDLFFGDAGAYMAGFMVGAMGVLLAARTDVSAFVSILVMAYPVYETLFSIVRKKRREGYSPSQPDGVHMHMLVARRYARFVAFGLDRPELKNPITGAMMWMFSLVASVMAIFAQGTNIGGIIGLIVFALFYGRIYLLVSLQKPSFLQRRAKAWGWDEGERFRRAAQPVKEV
jgi:UDP-N-acetylmuramyl pentapeptide phosphotransferase/UDP-N-acetylglucosamine-1-phosphate transferase